jgi:sulfoxide reductase heme-binding subunit YedZ
MRVWTCAGTFEAYRVGSVGARVETPRRWATPNTARRLSHVVAGWPLLHLAVDAWRGHLTANPIQAVTFRTGGAALACLVASLVVTPLSVIGRQAWASPLRRPIGLWAFAYASMHLATFAVLDYGLDWSLIWQTVLEKRYVVAGMASFVAMVPLAVTSTRGWQLRLGRTWRHLHRLSYFAAIASVVHFAWLVKADVREPLAWAIGLAVLFIVRLPPVRRRLSAFMVRMTRRNAA